MYLHILLGVSISIATKLAYDYIYSYYFEQNTENNHLNKLIFECPTLKPWPVEKAVWNEFNWKRTFDIDQADIWEPCGYKSIQRQLKDLNLTNKNTKIFGIDGADYIAGKTSLWNILKNEYARKIASDIIPPTYVFAENDFNLLMDEYEENDLYMLKSRQQGKKGLKLTRNLSYILSDAQSDGYLLAQKYMVNPYLIDGRKVNLRIYWLIVCRNGGIEAYISKFGKNLYTNKRFDIDNILDFEAHITFVNTTADVYRSRPLNTANLSLVLGKENYTKVRKQIVDISQKIFSASKPFLCKLEKFAENVRFQYFGGDYIFDTNMKTYFLEINKSPDVTFENDEDEEMKKNLIRDIMKIVHNGYKKEKHDFDALL